MHVCWVFLKGGPGTFKLITRYSYTDIQKHFSGTIRREVRCVSLLFSDIECGMTE